jgi:hypothetical protein
MGPGIIDIFDKTEHLLSEVISGCSKKTGVSCTAGVYCYCRTNGDGSGVASAAAAEHQPHQAPQPQNTDSMYQDNTAQANNNGYMSYQQPIQDSAPMGGGGDDANHGGGEGGAPSQRRARSSMRMSLGGRMSIGGMGGLSGLGRHLSLTSHSETTFGRAMSGLSALSIDWENMEDFDINVDHSEGINNDIINGQQQLGQGNANQADALGQGQDGIGAYGERQRPSAAR